MKVDDIVLRRVPRELVNFVDQVSLILNYGKYSSQTVVTPPTWVARNGEFAFYNSGTLNRVYFYSGNQWNYLEFNAAGNTIINGGSPANPNGSVQFNSGGFFGGSSGFTYDNSQGTILMNTTTDGGTKSSVSIRGNGNATILSVTNANAFHIFDVDQASIVSIGNTNISGNTPYLDIFGDSPGIRLQSGVPVAGGGGGSIFFDVQSGGTYQNVAGKSYSNVARFTINGINAGQSYVDYRYIGGGGTAEQPALSLGIDNLSIKGSYTNQRFYRFMSANITSSTSSNITNASTVYIEGAPSLSNSASIVNNYALWVDAGNTRFDGQVIYNSGAVYTNAINYASQVAPVSPIEGDFWNDSTQKSLITFVDSAKQALAGVLYTSNSNGIISNTTAETTVIGTGIGTLTIPANFFVSGKTVRLTACGQYSTQIIPVTFNMRVRLGGITGSAMLETGDQTPPGNVANLWWRTVTDIVCQKSGATGVLIGQSSWEHQTTATGSPVYWQMTTLGFPISTNTALQIQLTGQWGAGVAAADSMLCSNFSLEVLN